MEQSLKIGRILRPPPSPPSQCCQMTRLPTNSSPTTLRQGERVKGGKGDFLLLFQEFLSKVVDKKYIIGMIEKDIFNGVKII